MSSKLNNNWMAELSAGCSNESPAISEFLYEQLKRFSVAESISLIFKGDYLRKWKRSRPLTLTDPRNKKNDTQSSYISHLKIFSTQSHGRSHDRFFWVSKDCDTLFLRWYSKRKRSCESLFPLCTIKSIHRGDELTYFDMRDPFDGVNLKYIFILNGKYSLQLGATSETMALMWISGLYFAARYARTEYTFNWITNSTLFKKFLAVDKKKSDPDNKFESKTLKSYFNDKQNSLPYLSDYDRIKGYDDEFSLPTNLSHLVECMENYKAIARPENAVVLSTLVKRLLDFRNKTNSNFFQFTSTLNKNMKPINIIKACIQHLESLNVEYTVLHKELAALYPNLTQEECEDLFYNVVRQSCLKVIVSNASGGRNEFSTQLRLEDYETFLKNLQGADANEITTNIVEIQNYLKPITYIFDDPPKNVQASCFKKIAKPRIPVRFLTLLGFHHSLTCRFNDICLPQDSEEITDMLSLTLGDFWISSSHNTYLIGDQLGGSATASALADALIRGCRCIELDCQDGSEEPVLCHAWKNCHLTGSVTLKEGLVAIKHSAFETSKLPVILSFEMHCSDEFKLMATQLVVDILGDDLITLEGDDPVDLIATSEVGSLLNKFIIKAKFKSPENSFLGVGETAWQSIITLRGIDIDEADEKNLDRIKHNTVFAISETKFLKMTKGSSLIKDLTSRCFVRVYPSATRLASTNFCPVKPWSLGVQFAALNFQSYDRSTLLNHGRFYNSLGYVPKLIYNNLYPNGLGESGDLDHLNSVKKEINNDMLLKIHVLSGTQLCTTFGFEEKNYSNSFSNVLYSIGTEHMPLDMSNLKKSVFYKFKEKKKLKKAVKSGLIVEEEDTNSTLFEILDKSAKVVLEHKERVCPYVEVSVVGEGEDTFQTKPVNFNVFNPVWSDSNPPFNFRIKNPNEAIILFYVKNFDKISSEIIGQAAFPVNRLRPGVRWVQLLDSKFMEIECSGLLVHVEMKYKN